MSAPARILLLGGSGLLGEPAARALVVAGHDVTVLTRGARPVPAGTRARIVDRGDGAALAAALGGERFDLAIDLLAYDGVDVARLFAVPGLALGRYVMISSGQVYLVGEAPRPPFAEADAAQPLAPEPPDGTRDHANWIYGAGKRDAERTARAHGARLGMPVTLLRLPVVQGARDSSRRLWAYVQRLLDGGPLLLPEGGANPVRFVWAEDVARALCGLVETPAPPASAYNLAQPDEPRLAEFLATAAAVLGIEPTFVPCSWEDLEAAGLDHAVSVYSGRWCSRPDPALAARDLGFTGTPSRTWLPAVVRAQLGETRPEPHPGYARRASELALAARLVAARGSGAGGAAGR